MKKAVIPTLLILAVVLASSLRDMPEAPDQIADFACTVISPMFWQLLDELLELQLARSASPASTPAHTDGWQPESLSDSFICLVFQFVLSGSLDSSASISKISRSAMSISQNVVRRKIGRQNRTAHELPASVGTD